MEKMNEHLEEMEFLKKVQSLKEIHVDMLSLNVLWILQVKSWAWVI